MKIDYSCKKTAGKLGPTQLEAGKVYRSASVDLATARIFIASGAHVIALDDGGLYERSYFDAYVEVSAHLCVTGDVP